MASGLATWWPSSWRQRPPEPTPPPTEAVPPHPALLPHLEATRRASRATTLLPPRPSWKLQPPHPRPAPAAASRTHVTVASRARASASRALPWPPLGLAPPLSSKAVMASLERRVGRCRRGRSREAWLAGEPTPGAAAAGRNPSRSPDWEKEAAALDGDGERGAVPAGVEEGGACRRGMLWVEREAPPPA